MPNSIRMTNKQHVAAGITLLDEDGQAFASKPDDVLVEFTSSDPAVAEFVVGPDGLNGDVTSGQVGACTISAVVTLPNGTMISDQLAVAVANSAPGSVNFTVGSPVDEG